jgi:hypothetical protein
MSDGITEAWRGTYFHGSKNESVPDKKVKIKELEDLLSRLRSEEKKIRKEIDRVKEELREVDPNNWEFGEDPGY